MNEDILFSRQGQLGIITLNRPQALHALTLAMIIELQHMLQLWQNDDTVQAVVIQGTPQKVFCAGGDIRSLYALRDIHHQQMMFFWHEYRLNHFIYRFQKPYIALMDGITMGGGVGISLHGAYPVAGDAFMFAMPETGIGFFPDIGASYLLARCPQHTGFYLGLTGRRLNADDAYSVGLVRYVVPSSSFPTLLNNLAGLDLSKHAHAKVEACIQSLVRPILPSDLSEYRDEIERCFGQISMIEVMHALTEKNTEWHQNVLRDLAQKAPLSLCVTLEQLKRARGMSMAECVQMDYSIVGHFMRSHDFYEGVRALLVDKDKNPHWQPAAVADVTKAQVAHYFESGMELPLLETEASIR